MLSKENLRSNEPGKNSQENDYFAAIESRFQQLRGTPILVSPRDWLRIASWREQGIPKEAVLRGIEAAFRRKTGIGGGGTIRSLAYCEPFVVEQWQRHRSESVTRREAHRLSPAAAWNPESIREHLARVRDTILRTVAEMESRRPALGDHLRSLAERLAEESGRMDSHPSPEVIGELEKRLTAMEMDLAAAGRRVLDPEEMRRIQVTVDGELSSYRKGMSEDTFRETLRVIIDDRVRSFLSLPRLSLFSLS